MANDTGHVRRRNARGLVVLGVLGGFVAGVAPVSVAAGASVGPLRVAYTGSASNTSDVCTANPDGSNKVCVSSGYRPAVRPGGTDMYFVDNHNNDPSGTRAIYRSRTDGTNVRLVQWDAFSAGPESVDVSANGKKIAYDEWIGNSPFSDRQIVVANADGSGRLQLTNFVASDPNGPSRPTLSPDGSTVVFMDCTGGQTIIDYGNICTVPVTGGTPSLLTRGGEDPRWADNGRIAFTDVATHRIVLIDPSGSNRVVTPVVGQQPALSPDGRQLAFTRQLADGWHVMVANVDGSSERDLGWGHNPDWYPGSTPATATPPSIAITAPTGGEIVGGQPVTFGWTASGNISSVSVALEGYEPTLLHGTRNETFNPNAISFGFTVANLAGTARSFTWTPPVNMQYTSRLVRVAVTDTQGQVAVAVAGPVTTRPGPTAPPYVRVAYPDIGERWAPGDVRFSSWQAIDPDGVARSEVRLSTDGGVTFPIRLAAVEGDTTNASFTVPNTPTTRAKVRVMAWDHLGNRAWAVSRGEFEILGSFGLASMTVSPTSVVGGATAQATATLNAPAPAGGTTIELSSSNTDRATVPPSVTVPAGASSVTFPMTSKPVSQTSTVAVIGALNGRRSAPR